jgi:hypothetical protein
MYSFGLPTHYIFPHCSLALVRCAMVITKNPLCILLYKSKKASPSSQLPHPIIKPDAFLT